MAINKPQFTNNDSPKTIHYSPKTAHCFIIAEAGVNHNGSVERVLRMVDAAVEAGVDAVKFQTFRAESMVSRNAPKAEYQKSVTGEDGLQFEMIKNLELDQKAHKVIFKYCKKKKIMFLSSAFDLESIDLLNDLGLEIFKIPSGEITNLPYLRKIGALGKNIILSTGMADLEEIAAALDILCRAGTKKENITILHCSTEYPAAIENVNLRAMLTIKDILGVKVGYSDHTLGIEVPIAAVALGASVIEKHFTLDRTLEGPDHKVSLEPDELRAMVAGVRKIEKALGNGEKRSFLAERKNKRIVRKSIVAAKNIKKGEVFAPENITVKRPGIGISPFEIDEIFGRVAKKNFKKDELIKV